MKIAHISIYPPKGKKHSETGGVASYTKNLVTNIPYSKEDEVFVLCDKLKNNKETYEEDGVFVIRVFEKKLRLVFDLYSNIKEIKPDVIHIQQELNLYGGVVNAYLLQWLVFLFSRRTRVLITLHGVVDKLKVDKTFVESNFSSFPPVFVRIALSVIYKPLIHFASAIVVHEQLFKKIVLEQYGVKNENKINVILHGVEDFSVIDCLTARQQLSLPRNADIVLFMGYATGYKGIDLLIEGFAAYSKKNPNSYLIVGAGKHPKLKNDPIYLEEYKRYEEKAQNLIPPEKLCWSGFVEESDISLYYSAANVSIYPYTISMSSSGPMAIAIGHQKPFLASTVFMGVFDDLVLFERNAESISSKLEVFFAEPQHFSQYSKLQKKLRAWDVCGEQTYKIYESLCHK